MLKHYFEFKELQASPDTGQKLLWKLSMFPDTTLADGYLNITNLSGIDYTPKDLVKLVFVWIFYAMRTLSVDEIVHAVEAPEDIQHSDVKDKQTYLQGADGPFIQLEHSSVRLSHESMQNFFHYTPKRLLPSNLGEAASAHLCIITRCLDCLLSCTSATMSESILTAQPLLRDAAEH